MKTLTRNTVAGIIISISTQANATLIINEIDYDQPGADTAEFIELYNSSPDAILLDGFTLELINGSNQSSYRNIDLSGFVVNTKSYMVVCSDASLVLNCNHEFTTSSSWLQNGAPDAIALYDDTSTLLDSLSYEGTITGYTEGSPASVSDSNTIDMSLARIPDGVDSNDNLVDFQSACITPGTANLAGTGNCSTEAVSAVPVPAAVWLFASGLLGLTQIARRKV